MSFASLREGRNIIRQNKEIKKLLELTNSKLMFGAMTRTIALIINRKIYNPL